MLSQQIISIYFSVQGGKFATNPPGFGFVFYHFEILRKMLLVIGEWEGPYVIPPAQFPRPVLESPLLETNQGASEHPSVASNKVIGLEGLGVLGGGGLGVKGMRPYSSLPDCIATQACLQSLPLPTAQFDQIRGPSRCGSARGQEDTRRGHWWCHLLPVYNKHCSSNKPAQRTSRPAYEAGSSA